MKKIIVLTCSLLVFAACKKSEEVKIDHTETEIPADTIVKKDTVVATETKTEETPVPELKTEIKITKTTEAKEIKAEIPKDVKVEYASFGSKIAADKALTKEQMLKKYATLKKGDTVSVKFKSRIKDVCKKKGCWMKMDLADNKESFVRFKDYGFFVPLNADDSEAIVSGRAFLDVISVDELKHYAKDGGKSQEDIDKIKEPKVTYAFQADGVLIQK